MNNFITNESIDLHNEIKKAGLISCGAVVHFSGLVRNHNEGKPVLALEYEAFQPLANKMIQEILDNVKEKFSIQYASCIHRIGRLELGEIAVIVVTSSSHRKECYSANQYIIDKVKHEIPIWKREFFADGTITWSKGCEHEH